MQSIPRRVIVRLSVAECPICQTRYVILPHDLRVNKPKLCRCGFQSRIMEWPYDEDREVEIIFSEDDVIVYDDL